MKSFIAAVMVVGGMWAGVRSIMRKLHFLNRDNKIPIKRLCSMQATITLVFICLNTYAPPARAIELEFLGGLDSIGMVTDIIPRENGIVYIADDRENLRSIDIGIFDEPFELDRFSCWDLQNIGLIENYLLLPVNFWTGTIIADISDPANIIIEDTLRVWANLHPMATLGNLIGLQQVNVGVQLRDFTDYPDSIPILSQINGEWGDEMEIDGNTLYLFNSHLRYVRAYDIADPTNPTIAATIELQDDPRGFDVFDGKVFVSGKLWATRIYDFSDPYAPNEICRFGPWHSRSISVYRERAAIIDNAGLIQFFQLSDDYSHISSIINLDTPGFAMIVKMIDNIVYVADSSSFEVYRFNFNGVKEDRSTFPTSEILLSAYPNPFNGFVNISFSNPINREATLSVFDGVGREVWRMPNAEFGMRNGVVKFVWNAEGMAGGSYYVRMATPGSVMTQKVVLVR